MMDNNNTKPIQHHIVVDILWSMQKIISQNVLQSYNTLQFIQFSYKN